ncbi:MAG: type IV secretory system conjugative DNA transfer family protein, partial [Bacteroidota bacterium]
EENPRNIFEGYIIHVLSTYPKECHTLPFVYDLLRGVNPETGNVDFDFQKKVLLDMFKNKACGGLASNAASLLTDIGPNERGSMLSTMSRHLKWIGDENMRAHLQGSDFSFRDFGIKKTKVKGKEVEVIETLYIILPDPKIKEFMRYIRLMSTIAIRVMQTREEKPKISTLLIIDEFPRLGGKIEVIAEGFSILRSYGIKLWCFIQTYGQLLHDYPKQASSMVGNSTVQVFGVGMGDDETSEFVSKTLGSRIIRQYDRRKTVLGFSKKIVVNETARELLTPAEVTTKLGKSANMQIIFPNDGLPMRLERLAFKSLKMKKRKFRTIGLGGLKKQIE